MDIIAVQPSQFIVKCSICGAVLLVNRSEAKKAKTSVDIPGSDYPLDVIHDFVTCLSCQGRLDVTDAMKHGIGTA